MIMPITEITNKEYLDVVRRFAALAQFRDRNIRNHLERIRGYSLVISKGYGLSLQEANTICYASQLHDIGEIGIPDSILSKSGELTTYEWEILKRHTVIGADILKGSLSVILQAGEIIALTHHERWNGSGYPQGLKGEDIPLSGRVCAIADVFDALTTKRSYKDIISVEEAVNLLQETRGELLDPELVDVFVENLDEIRKIRIQYS